MTNPDNKETMLELFKNALSDTKIRLIDFIPFEDINWLQSDKPNKTLAYIKTESYYTKMYSTGKDSEGKHNLIRPENFVSVSKDTFDKKVEMLQINFENDPHRVKLYIIKNYRLEETVGEKVFLNKKGILNYFKSPVEVTELHMKLGEPFAMIGFQSDDKNIKAYITLEEYNALYDKFKSEIKNRENNLKPENKLKALNSSYKSRTKEDHKSV